MQTINVTYGRWKGCKLNVLKFILSQNKLDQRVLGHCSVSDTHFQAGVWTASKRQKEDPLLQWNKRFYCLRYPACCAAGTLTEPTEPASISVWIMGQVYSAQMKVEPNLDFNTIGSPDSWQYVLVLSFNVTLHRSTSKMIIPILSTG